MPTFTAIAPIPVRQVYISVQAAPFDALDRLWFGRPASSPAGFSHTPAPPHTRLPHIAHLDLHRRSRLHPNCSPMSALQLSAPSTPVSMAHARAYPPSPRSLSQGIASHSRSASLPVAAISPMAQKPSSPCSTPGGWSDVGPACRWPFEAHMHQVVNLYAFKG